MVKKKPSRKKKAAKAKPKGRKKSPPRKKRARRRAGPGSSALIHQGVGLTKTFRSSDDQGLSTVEDVDSESVAELLDEGQAFEAEVVSGVENARDADEGEVRTKEVPEDDVPDEYRDSREQ
ncbi:MAG TPA: hypothetical protein VLY23_15950 [Candidatus Acidoferrum sp.]|nr:hypothetical protein [Candidatus Acidoferrum sp.]